ncbi:MAG: hypothetical protein WCL90_09990, partial [Planctomycetota bacterium]
EIKRVRSLFWHTTVAYASGSERRLFTKGLTFSAHYNMANKSKTTFLRIIAIFVAIIIRIELLNASLIKIINLTSTIQRITRYTDLNILPLNSIKLLEYAR